MKPLQVVSNQYLKYEGTCLAIARVTFFSVTGFAAGTTIIMLTNGRTKTDDLVLAWVLVFLFFASLVAPTYLSFKHRVERPRALLLAAMVLSLAAIASSDILPLDNSGWVTLYYLVSEELYFIAFYLIIVVGLCAGILVCYSIIKKKTFKTALPIFLFAIGQSALYLLMFLFERMGKWGPGITNHIFLSVYLYALIVCLGAYCCEKLYCMMIGQKASRDSEY